MYTHILSRRNITPVAIDIPKLFFTRYFLNSNTLRHIPITNQISFERMYEITCTPSPPKIPKALKVSATLKPINAIVLLLNVGVIKNKKNKAYKYQYGDVGWRNSVSPNPPISLFTDEENKVFKTHVARENVK